MFLISIFAFIFFKANNKPVLVGLKLIFFIHILESLISSAATIKNEAEEKSPGTVILEGFSSFRPLIEIIFNLFWS